MPHSGVGELVAADIQEQPEVLGRAVTVNSEALEHARVMIERSSLVRLIGIGSSKHSAGYGSQVIELLAGKPAIVMPAPGAAVAYPRFRSDQVVIVLSQSGETPALLAAATEARESGCSVVAVTNTPGSRLESIADVALACSAGPERVVAATKSVTAQMLLLRAASTSTSRTEVDDLVQAITHTISDSAFRAVVGSPPRSVVCGGFAGEWVADEIVLKFAEMAGLPVVSESVVEYFHGPAGAATPTLAFLDPNDPNSSELVDAENVVPVETASVSDASLDALVRLVAGQRIVLEWARSLGEDPDSSRGLSKVTRTH